MLNRLTLLVILLVSNAVLANAQTDPLPSWKEGPAKTAIVDFMASVLDQQGGTFVEPEDRIAVFDNDGTLWSEQRIFSLPSRSTGSGPWRPTIPNGRTWNRSNRCLPAT